MIYSRSMQGGCQKQPSAKTNPLHSHLENKSQPISYSLPFFTGNPSVYRRIICQELRQSIGQRVTTPIPFLTRRKLGLQYFLRSFFTTFVFFLAIKSFKNLVSGAIQLYPSFFLSFKSLQSRYLVTYTIGFADQS